MGAQADDLPPRKRCARSKVGSHATAATTTTTTTTTTLFLLLKTKIDDMTTAVTQLKRRLDCGIYHLLPPPRMPPPLDIGAPALASASLIDLKCYEQLDSEASDEASEASDEDTGPLKVRLRIVGGKVSRFLKRGWRDEYYTAARPPRLGDRVQAYFCYSFPQFLGKTKLKYNGTVELSRVNKHIVLWEDGHRTAHPAHQLIRPAAWEIKKEGIWPSERVFL